MGTTTKWLGVEDLAEELGVPVRTVYAWNHAKTGPRFARFGKYVRYRRDDVERWIETRLIDQDGAA